MKKILLSRELKIGIITIVTIVAFIWGYNYLKGKDFLHRQRTFYVVYNNVSGLMKANSVTISGLNIGQVNDIYFKNGNPNEVVVELVISNNIGIPANSIARIYSSDLLGARSVNIILGDSPIMAVSGDTLKSETQKSIQEEVNRMVQPIIRKAGSLMSSMDTVIIAVGEVFNFETRENLIRSIEGLRNTIGNLESSTGTIDTLFNSQKSKLSRIIANVESISTNLRQNNEDLSRIISNASLISDTIAKSNLSNTLKNLDQTVEHFSAVTKKIQDGKGSLGMLVNDDKLYNELETSSNQLNRLLEDIRLNPKRYVHFSVFGRSSKKLATPEVDTIK